MKSFTPKRDKNIQLMVIIDPIYEITTKEHKFFIAISENYPVKSTLYRLFLCLSCFTLYIILVLCKVTALSYSNELRAPSANGA